MMFLSPQKPVAEEHEISETMSLRKLILPKVAFPGHLFL